MSLPKFKDVNGITFFRKPYSNTWVISGIDICKEFGYKNPYEQAYKIYKRFEDNFKDTSFLIPVLKYKKEEKITPQSRGYFLDQNHKEIRCYTRAGLWFFASKCNIPKANKLIENLFKKFDKLINDLNKTKTQEWKSIREAGKEKRLMATVAMQILEEYEKERGSENSKMVYLKYTQLINRKVSGLKKPPPNYRNIATKNELQEISLLESLFDPWISQCIEERLDHHDIYRIIKEEVDKRLPMIRSSMIATIAIKTS